jgi:hypothetical protein
MDLFRNTCRLWTESELINWLLKALGKGHAGNNAFIEAAKTFKHDLGPGLIDRAFYRLDFGAKFKLRVRKRQSVIHRVYPVEHPDPCVYHRTGLQIEISGAPRVQNLKPAAFALITKELDQF